MQSNYDSAVYLQVGPLWRRWRRQGWWARELVNLQAITLPWLLIASSSTCLLLLHLFTTAVTAFSLVAAAASPPAAFSDRCGAAAQFSGCCRSPTLLTQWWFYDGPASAIIKPALSGIFWLLPIAICHDSCWSFRCQRLVPVLLRPDRAVAASATVMVLSLMQHGLALQKGNVACYIKLQSSIAFNLTFYPLKSRQSLP